MPKKQISWPRVIVVSSDSDSPPQPTQRTKRASQDVPPKGTAQPITTSDAPEGSLMENGTLSDDDSAQPEPDTKQRLSADTSIGSPLFVLQHADGPLLENPTSENDNSSIPAMPEVTEQQVGEVTGSVVNEDLVLAYSKRDEARALVSGMENRILKCERNLKPYKERQERLINRFPGAASRRTEYRDNYVILKGERKKLELAQKRLIEHQESLRLVNEIIHRLETSTGDDLQEPKSPNIAPSSQNAFI